MHPKKICNQALERQLENAKAGAIDEPEVPKENQDVAQGDGWVHAACNAMVKTYHTLLM